VRTNERKVLVTGASGLLGANLVFELAHRGCAVTAVYGRHAIALQGVRSAACDLANSAAASRLLADSGPDLVIHCAAATHVDWCESHAEECLRINGEAAGALAAAAKSLDAHFVYISTDAVFDGVCGGYRETDPVAPVNWYARSKAAGEAAVGREMPGALVLRVNLYGWNLQPKYSLAEWVLSRLESAQPVPGFTDITFAPILVNDLAEWILRLVELECAGTYHVASSDRCSKYQFAREIAAVFRDDVSLVRESRSSDSSLSAPRPSHTWLRTDKIAATLGHAMPTVREGLERFRALRENGFCHQLKAASAAPR
jgi:dTDP-4-dehydrorhamnose reductase